MTWRRVTHSRSDVPPTGSASPVETRLLRHFSNNALAIHASNGIMETGWVAGVSEQANPTKV